jgi:hypothetical protein
MASGWPGKGHGALLKNSFAASSAPGSVTEYAVLVVYWSRFRASLAPDRADDHFFNRLRRSQK